MARSLIGGLIETGYPAQSIAATDIDASALRALRDDFGIDTSTDNDAAARQTDVLVLAVKPQVMFDVCASLKEAAQSTMPLIVSIAAGIRAVDIDRWLGGGLPIVRCMPNTPALIRLGASGLYANSTVNDLQRQSAEQILAAVSRVVWVREEDQIDAVTAVSGSGPAYFFLVIEAMQAAARKLGLDEAQADALVLETACGATRMALDSESDAATLRANVTSKGGTTAAAIDVFEQHKLRDVFAEAMHAAAARSAQLGSQLGEK